MSENRFVSSGNEAALLKTAIMDETCLIDLLEIGDVEYFFQKQYMEFFLLLQKKFETNKHLDRIQIEGSLDDVTRKALQEIDETTASVDSFSDYFKVVHDKFLLRKLSGLGNNIQTLVNSDEDGEHIVAKVEESLGDLLGRAKKQSIYKLGDHYKDVLLSTQISGILSGFHKLDDLIIAFDPQSYNIIAGRPSAGKTEFCRNILIYNALQGIPVLLFSLEESKNMIIMKSISQITGIPYYRLKKKAFTTGDLKALDKWEETISELPLYISDHPHLTPTTLKSTLKKFYLKHTDLGAIAIDYVQLMEGTGSSQNERLTNISRSIKLTAKLYDLPVFALSQLSRASEIERREPQLSDLRDSGSLEQDADRVIFMHVPPDQRELREKETLAILAKQRDGALGRMELINKCEIQKFEEIQKEPDYPEGERKW